MTHNTKAAANSDRGVRTKATTSEANAGGGEHRIERAQALFSEPLLLPGEDRVAYDQLLAELTDAVRPEDSLEKLWVSEAVAKHWLVLRHRRHKRGFIAARRQAGLQSVLKPLVSYGSPFASDTPEDLAGTLAWKYTLADPGAVKEVDELFKAAQLSAEAIDGEVVAIHIETLATFDQLIWAAEKRRDACLREIEHHRAPFGRALRGAIVARDHNEIASITAPAEQKKAAA